MRKPLPILSRDEILAKAAEYQFKADCWSNLPNKSYGGIDRDHEIAENQTMATALIEFAERHRP